MARKPNDDSVPDKEAERRATEGLRRMLTTPHTPQRAQVGALGRKAAVKRKAKQLKSKR